MFEIKNWNGHRVLAIPLGARQDPVIKAYRDAVWGLANDLGVHDAFRRCRPCPMYRADAETGRRQCAHPLGAAWAVLRGVAQGGCAGCFVVAEEYIPLVQMRLGPANPNR